MTLRTTRFSRLPSLRWTWRIGLGLLLLAAIGAVLSLPPIHNALQAIAARGTVASLRDNQAWLAAEVAQLGWRAPVLFCAIYIGLTGLTLPVNVPLSIAAGAMFGWWQGVVLCALSTSAGASLSCLSSRTLLRGWVMRRLHGRLAEIEAGLEADGALYLLTLRLMPLVPYTVVNLLFGLTSMSLPRFFTLTLLGTLPATTAFVNAGTQLQALGSDGAALGMRLVVSLTLLGCVPLVVARINRWRQAKRT